MPKRITLVEQLSTEELEQYDRHAKVGIESCQFQALWLLSCRIYVSERFYPAGIVNVHG